LVRLQTVEEIMTKSLISVGYDAPLPQALELMQQHRITHLLVEQKKEYTKVLSLRDVFNLLPRNATKLGAVRSGPLASSRPVWIPPKTKIREAAKVMLSRKARSLLVRAEPVGLLTATDLAYNLPLTAGKHPKLKSAMTGHVLKVDYSTPLEAVVETMKRNRVGSVLVMRGHRRYGIFTERDILLFLGPPCPDLSYPVGMYCSKPVITTPITASCVGCFEEAVKAMKRKYIKRLPVTRDGRIVGIVTARDVVEAYAKL